MQLKNIVNGRSRTSLVRSHQNKGRSYIYQSLRILTHASEPCHVAIFEPLLERLTRTSTGYKESVTPEIFYANPFDNYPNSLMKDQK